MTLKNLKEDLNRLYEPPMDSTAAQAQKMGLIYVGFGRYKDPNSGQITYISQNGKLIPYRQAVKTNTFKQNSTDDIGAYKEAINPETSELHEFLVANYQPDKYNDKQLDAIYNYTNGGYADINSRLSQLPAGVTSKQIEPESVDDSLPEMIDSLDSAIKKTRSPMDFLVYCNLGSDIEIDNLVSGINFVLKGYMNTSIDVTSVIDNADMSRVSPVTGRTQVAVLQILIKKNSKGIYLSDFSATPEDTEFLLPRDSVLTVTTGPNQLVGGHGMSENINLEVVYYECVLNNR